MKNFTVKFYYYTDLRCDWVGQATNELAALVLAMNEHALPEWSSGKGFRIEIHYAL